MKFYDFSISKVEVELMSYILDLKEMDVLVFVNSSIDDFIVKRKVDLNDIRKKTTKTIKLHKEFKNIKLKIVVAQKWRSNKGEVSVNLIRNMKTVVSAETIRAHCTSEFERLILSGDE